MVLVSRFCEQSGKIIVIVGKPISFGMQPFETRHATPWPPWHWHWNHRNGKTNKGYNTKV